MRREDPFEGQRDDTIASNPKENEGSGIMAKRQSSNVQGQTMFDSDHVMPPFVYLSAVLKQYGNLRVPHSTSGLGCVDKEESDQGITFCQFLAKRIKSAKVSLFDVSTLKLIGLGEQEEMLFYLHSYSSNEIEHPLNVGMSYGLDYCVDAGRLKEEIQGVVGWPMLEFQSVLGQANKSENQSLPKTPPVSVYFDDSDTGKGEGYIPTPRSDLPKRKNKTPVSVRDFTEGEDPVPVPQVIVEFKLADGRVLALRRSVPTGPMWARNRVPVMPDFSEYRGARKVNLSHHCISNWIYLSGKFNKAGDPALFLEKVQAKKIPPITVGPRGHIHGTRLAIRFLEWQSRLLAMYKSGPNKGKSHSELCQLLAKQLGIERPPSVKKEINPKTIQRETNDPGGRKPGGSRPRS